MSSSSLIRLGGLAAFVGGVPVVVLWLSMPGDWTGSPLATPATHSSMVGAMAVVVALHALQRGYYGLLGAAASLAAFVGLALYLVGAWIAYARDDFWLAFLDTTFLVLLGLLLATGGLITLGIVTISAGVLPWWCGAALIAGNPIFGFFLGDLLGAGLLWGVPWVVVGFAVFLAAGRRTERPARVR